MAELPIDEPPGPLCRLAIAAKKGDRAALEQFASSICSYVLWAVRIRRGLRRSGRAGSEDSDLASVAWIAILENLARLEVRSDQQLKAWLRRVVTTKAADADASRRAAMRDPARAQSLDELLRGGDESTPEVLRTRDSQHVDEVLRRADLHEIVAAIAQLPEELAEPLWIIDFDGCSQREAARLLDESETMIRRRYARAKAQLAILLGWPTERD